MAEGLAEKRPCPECGGYLEWSARKQALACPYCGTVVGAPRGHQPDMGPAARDTAGHAHEPDGSVASSPALDGSFQGEFVAGVPGHAADDRALAREAETLFGPKADIDHHALQEQDLEAALRDPANLRNWGAERFELKCQSCQAISVFVNAQVADRCSFCGSPAIVSHEAMRDAITPQSVLPFKYDDTQVRDILRAWYGKRWFAPSRLKKAAATDTLKGIYLPYWTFDARAFSRWSAEAGHYYYTTEQVRGTDGRIETRQVQHVRWVPAMGELEHFFDDELVPGTVGIHPKLLRRIEPFPTTTDLKAYSPDFVRGWTVERYQVDLREATTQGRRQMQHEMEAMCARMVPGNTYRNLMVDTQFTGCTFKHVLVPVWLVRYTYGHRVFQVVVNGYTGRVAGERPYSWMKIAFAVLAVVLLLAALALFQGR